MSMRFHLNAVLLCALLAPMLARAQLLLSFHQATLQYGGAGTNQVLQQDPWFAAATTGLWEGEADAAGGDMHAGVVNGIGGSANTYTFLQYRLRNTDPVNPVAILGASMLFDASRSILGDGGDGSGSTLLVGAMQSRANGQTHVARLDFTHFALCQNNLADCRSSTDTRPVLAGGGTASVLADSPSFVQGLLGLPGLTLPPRVEVEYLFALQAAASSGGGWTSALDATHTAQLRLLLPAGASLASDRPLAWVSVVPEPASALLAMLSGAMLFVRLRRQVG
jgi:hypothetical protein